jgi:predicted nucleic acid-binding protein
MTARPLRAFYVRPATVPEARWVLDASVAVKWFFTDEPLRSQALAVRAHIANRPDTFFVPHLFITELVHVLARKSGRDEAFVCSATDLVVRLGLRTLGLSVDGVTRAVSWTCRGLSGYDATYLALADEVSGRWVTADAAAADRAGPGRARLLADWR